MKLYMIDSNGEMWIKKLEKKAVPDIWGIYYIVISNVSEYKKPKNEELFYYTARDGTQITIFPKRALKMVKKIKKERMKVIEKSEKKLKTEIFCGKGKF